LEIEVYCGNLDCKAEERGIQMKVVDEMSRSPEEQLAKRRGTLIEYLKCPICNKTSIWMYVSTESKKVSA